MYNTYHLIKFCLMLVCFTTNPKYETVHCLLDLDAKKAVNQTRLLHKI